MFPIYTMSSTMRSFSGKTGNVFNNGGYAPNLFQVSDIETALGIYTSRPLFAKISETLYMAKSKNSLHTGLNTLNTSIPPTLSAQNEYIVEDMGKKICLGFEGANNLIVFSKVKRTLVDPNNTNVEFTGYVVSENRTTYQTALYPPNWRGGA